MVRNVLLFKLSDQGLKMILKIESRFLQFAAVLAGILLADTALAQTESDRLWLDAQTAIDTDDYAAAVPLLAELADRGSLRAAELLGDFHAEGRIDGEVDQAAARRWWRQAAMGGVAEAQYNLAVSYREGLGAPVDIDRAIRWYREAADRGDHASKYQLGQLLLVHGDDSYHAEGYMYSRLAVLAGSDGMSLAGERATGRYRRDDPTLSNLREAAASGLWTNALADPAHPLSRSSVKLTIPPFGVDLPGLSDDRDEGHAYAIDHFMRAIFGMQGRAGRSLASHDPDRATESFSAVLNVGAELYAQIGMQTSGHPIIVYPFHVTGTQAASATAAYLSAERLWSIARPGDIISVSDRSNHHTSFVFGVDRTADVITLADVRPDEFLLLPGRNVVDARAEVGGDGSTRRLVTATHDDLIRSVVGLGVVADSDFPDLLLTAYPDLAGDWRVRLSLGTALLGTLTCKNLDAASTHIAKAHELGADADPASRNSIADRAYFARVSADACRAAGSPSAAVVSRLAAVPDGNTQSLTLDEMLVLSFVLSGQGKFDSARELAQRRFDGDPEAPEGLLMLALADIETGAWAEAAARLTDAIDRAEARLAEIPASRSLDPATSATRERWLNVLAVAYLERGGIMIQDDPETAYQDAERALALNPGDQIAIELVRDAGRLSGHLRRVSELHGEIRDRELMTPLFELYGLGN